MGHPAAYFLTFSCYGKRLPGDDAAYVDRRNNIPKTPLPAPDRARVITAKRRMVDPPQTLDPVQRDIVLESIRNVCRYRGRLLYAAHVRSNHVHVVVEAHGPPSVPLHDLKAYATRALNRHTGSARRRWAAHGSTRYLWTEQHVRMAMKYVATHQGKAMAIFLVEPPLEPRRV